MCFSVGVLPRRRASRRIDLGRPGDRLRFFGLALLAACGGPTSSAPPPVEVSAASCASERALEDRPDDSELHQVRALYVIPADGADEQYDTSGRICRSLASITRWLSIQTNGRTLRLDTRDGVLDVGFVRLTKSDVELRGTGNIAEVATGWVYVRDRIEQDLRQLGALRPGKLYAVYYGGSTPWACGGGAWPPANVGQVAGLYLHGAPPGAPPCDTIELGAQDATAPGYLEYAMVHELFHSLGFVADAAPHEHAEGHSSDGTPGMARDLMYAVRPGTNDPLWDTFHPEGLILDIGRDDYLDHGRTDVLDLARSAFLEPLPSDASLPPGW